ncbi:uncharacterized protein BYT42DRAFT_129901 [Radiomyces spectabilis]|uniref:uncharacterized protein n=1 Tax=Radiomyces spectabilis TaxID=64574 RepID=UPI002220F61F|nr:uncharacterized protein BYT42DRAFT_129901 [Radiomyces spectabilis]KAI8367545.1 hypothetical protein BYT42DRAFT_129901 [Radiomyces spectabilis]
MYENALLSWRDDDTFINNLNATSPLPLQEPSSIPSSSSSSSSKPPPPPPSGTTSQTNSDSLMLHRPSKRHANAVEDHAPSGSVVTRPKKARKLTTTEKLTSTSKTTNQENEEEQKRRKDALARNRIAASKCRQRNKEWQAELVKRVETAQQRNNELRQLVNVLRNELYSLRYQLLAHHG